LFHRVLQNRIRDWGRRNSVRRRWRVWLRGDPGLSDADDPIQSLPDPRGRLPEERAANEAAIQDLVQAVGELPGRQRQAVLLRIWEGLDVAETAQAMGCSAGSVKTHLARGLARLRDRLEDSR
jgi:RNA polymerase sigma-70 factor (ECF subfamily)